jgi:DNA-directed RNA polymerase specialized sigma24 family protein
MLEMPNSPMMHAEVDEAALVRAVQQGDVEYFEPLVDFHLAAVRTFLSLKAPVPQLIDELAHETFLFAFRHLNDFKPGTSFRNWLRAIAWNLLRAEILRFSRREARFKQLEDAWLLESAMQTEKTAPSPDADFLEECFAMLPEDSQALVNLH